MQNKTTRREQEHIQNKKYTERTGKKNYTERTGIHAKIKTKRREQENI